MKVSIRGGANLHVIDRNTNEVKAIHSFNLVTKYGLSRILAPTDRGESIATHLCIGYKSDEPSVYEDAIPANYFIMSCIESISPYIANNEINETSWKKIVGDELPVGFQFNHVYLAYKDKNGILHPLTSLKFKNSDGTPFEYTHVAKNSIGIYYSLSMILGTSTGSSSAITSVSLTNNSNLYDEFSWFNRELAGHGKKYESSKSDNDVNNFSYIKNHNGYFNEAGNWIQTYDIAIKALSYGNDICFRIGICYVLLKSTTHRANEVIELKFEIMDLPEEYGEPKPVTAIVSSPTGTSYESEVRSIKIIGAPYQVVEIYSGNYLLLTQTLNKSGEVTAGSNPTNVFDITTGLSVPAPETWMLSSGGKLRVVSKTRKGTVDTELIAPDLQASDVRAIWFIAPNTIRVVSNYNDVIQLSWCKEYTDTRVNSINKGTCTTTFDEDPRYYYCDIDVSEFDPQIHRKVSYLCTDAAGNIFNARSNSNKLLINYVDGLNYSKANNYTYEFGLSRELGFSSGDPENDYHMALKILSGDIS